MNKKVSLLLLLLKQQKDRNSCETERGTLTKKQNLHTKLPRTEKLLLKPINNKEETKARKLLNHKQTKTFVFLLPYWACPRRRWDRPIRWRTQSFAGLSRWPLHSYGNDNRYAVPPPRDPSYNSVITACSARHIWGKIKEEGSFSTTLKLSGCSSDAELNKISQLVLFNAAHELWGYKRLIHGWSVVFLTDLSVSLRRKGILKQNKCKSREKHAELDAKQTLNLCSLKL